MPGKSRQATGSYSVGASLIRMGLALALVGLALVLAWNARWPDLVTRQEKAEQYAGSFDADHPLGQSFIAGHDRLSALQFFGRAAPEALNSNISLILHLRESPDSSTDLVVTRLPLSALRDGPALTFSFPPQASENRPLFALLETDAPPNQVALLASRGDAYTYGSLYLDGQPIGRDLAFRAYTTPDGLNWLSSLLAAGGRLGWMLVITLFFTALGGSLLVLMDAGPQNDLSGGKAARRVEWLIVAIVSGVSVGPILWTVCAPFRIRLDPQVLQGAFLAVLLLAALKMLYRHLSSIGKHALGAPQTPTGRLDAALEPAVGDFYLPKRSITALTVVGLFGLALIVRVLQIEDLSAPLWVDGLTHANTIQSILQTGGLPTGLLYHVGFHANVVALQAFTNLPIPELMLLYGQWIGALSGLTLYLFAKRILGPALQPGNEVQLSFLASAVGLWFFAQVPAHLVNWGRYPFMQGVALLPGALAVTLEALSKRKPANYALAAILVAGLFLTHYGMISFWLTFMLTWAVWKAWQGGYFTAATRRRFQFPAIQLTRRFIFVVSIAVLGILALGLRFGALWTEGTLASLIAQSRQNVQDLNLADILHLNFRSGGLWLGIVGLGGLILAAFRYRQVLLLVGGWFFAQAAFITLQAPLFGEALASYTNLFLALSLPLAIFAGLFCYELATPAFPKAPSKKTIPRMPETKVTLLEKGAFLCLVVLAIAGSYTQKSIITPATVLYAPADHQAMQWIRENTPSGARFLVNSNYWGGLNQQIVPSDGGGWIEMMTGRPVEFLQSEEEQQDLAEYVRSRQVDYIYMGAFPGFLDQTLLSETADPLLLESLEQVYHQDGIRIFRLRSDKP